MRAWDGYVQKAKKHFKMRISQIERRSCERTRSECRIGLVAAHDSNEMSKAFTDLEEREILALAVALEEEDGRIYRDFAEKLKASHPAIAT